jgi:hypothetical protein
MRKKWDLIVWEKPCEPKYQGGLGLNDPLKMGQDLPTIFFWRWLKISEALWAKNWQDKYARDIHPQYWIKMDGAKSGSLIWIYAWKKCDLMKTQSFWELHNGKLVLFWEDAWEKRPDLSSNELLNPIQ